MLLSTMSVLDENEESLLSDLAPITACAGRGHWVQFGHCGKWLTTLSILTLLLLMLTSQFYLQYKLHALRATTNVISVDLVVGFFF